MPSRSFSSKVAILSVGFTIAVAGALLAPTLVAAQTQAGVPSPPPFAVVTLTVSVLGPNSSAAPALAQTQLQAAAAHTNLNVTQWEKASAQKPEDGVQLAILIDKSNSAFGSAGQIDDLAAFIQSQPLNAVVALYYAVDGTVKEAARFSGDHEGVAMALRATAGGDDAGGSSSVYLALDNLVAHWPAAKQKRREVLLLASGIDHLSPSTEGLNIEPDSYPNDPYRDTAIEHAQQIGVMVHTIFMAGAHFDSNRFRKDFAQRNLGQLAAGTGGVAASEDVNSAHSLAAALQNVDLVLRNQYLLTFTVDRSQKDDGELRGLHLKTDQRDVELVYPKQVWIPGPKRQGS